VRGADSGTVRMSAVRCLRGSFPAPFPNVSARDLTGRDLQLPAGFEGERNVVIMAFKRHQQTDVDSWMPWLDERAAFDPGLRFYELPTISDIGAPARRFIDGGMAAAIADPAVRHRTLTVYGDLRRLTDPLEIDDRDTIWLFVVDGSGLIRWRGAGRFDPDLAGRVATALDGLVTDPDIGRSELTTAQFPFAFDRRFRPLLALAGVTPGHAQVTVTADRLLARYGPWSLETRLDNIAEVCLTRNYEWYKAIGPRGSFADRGLTFGTNTDAGVCVRFHHPVRGLDPLGLVRHPGLTMTVEDPEALAALLRRRTSPHRDTKAADTGHPHGAGA
jgi:hypothetical protein